MWPRLASNSSLHLSRLSVGVTDVCYNTCYHSVLLFLSLGMFFLSSAWSVLLGSTVSPSPVDTCSLELLTVSRLRFLPTRCGVVLVQSCPLYFEGNALVFTSVFFYFSSSRLDCFFLTSLVWKLRSLRNSFRFLKNESEKVPCILWGVCWRSQNSVRSGHQIWTRG